MKYCLLALVLCLVACGGKTGIGLVDGPSAGIPDTHPTPASYHGGPVVTKPLNIYLIWYGDWKNNTDTSNLVNYFLNNLSSSPYYDIDRSYYEISGSNQVNVTRQVSVTQNLYVGSPRGIALTGADIGSVVSDALTQYGLQPDPNGFYMVLTDIGVQVQGLCYGDCGWHNYTQINGVTITFSHIGNGQQCATTCTPQEFYTDQNGNQASWNSPNNNWTADSIINIIAHELSETLTDPQLNAWYQENTGGEIGDLCAWNFGDVSWIDQETPYNITVGKKKFLVQQLWYEAQDQPDGGVCALQP